MSAPFSRLLEARARALATVSVKVSEDGTAAAIVVAALGADRIGIPLTAAREVIPFAGAASIPAAPAWFRGIVQLRGELLSVLDLQAWWRPGQSCRGKHLVVVEGKAGPIALLADAIVEVRDVTSRDLADALADDALQARPGVGSVTRDLIFVLDIERMLSHSALVIHQTSALLLSGESGEHE
ncbi:MAG: chemotaxis protein CheW [Deltaproteobacteria bacterium]|nr:chemotaxis protein CheW [Deltaproteobacteria bacterium]